MSIKKITVIQLGCVRHIPMQHKSKLEGG